MRDVEHGRSAVALMCEEKSARRTSLSRRAFARSSRQARIPPTDAQNGAGFLSVEDGVSAAYVGCTDVAEALDDCQSQAVATRSLAPTSRRLRR